MQILGQMGVRPIDTHLTPRSSRRQNKIDDLDLIAILEVGRFMRRFQHGEVVLDRDASRINREIGKKR
jgi:hypothetical protein